eukprot:scaffold133893_cov68-Attheya_sp.AAC.1
MSADVHEDIYAKETMLSSIGGSIHEKTFKKWVWPLISAIANLDSLVGEHIEADDGYIGEAPVHVKCPKSFTNPPEIENIQQQAHTQQETVNKIFKQWGCMFKKFCHDIVLMAIAIHPHADPRNHSTRLAGGCFIFGLCFRCWEPACCEDRGACSVISW